MAVVCASVPVFWPVLQSGGFQIFITREVKITSESLFGSGDGEDVLELYNAGAVPAGRSDPEIGAGMKRSSSHRRSPSVASDRTLQNTSTNRSSADEGSPSRQKESSRPKHVESVRRPQRALPGNEVSVFSNDHMVKTTPADWGNNGPFL